MAEAIRCSTGAEITARIRVSAIALNPVATLGAYGNSKAAVISLIRTIAEENREHGIRANVASLLVWLVSGAGAEGNGVPGRGLERSGSFSVKSRFSPPP